MAAGVLNQVFWNEHFFLPNNYTWKDIKDPGAGSDLIYPIYIGVALILVRMVLERNVFQPLGLALGIPAKSNNNQALQCSKRPALEKGYTLLLKKVNKPTYKELEKLAKEVGLEVRQVQRWARKRSNTFRMTRMDKFCESGWRFVCYVILSSYGFVVTVNKPWFWNTTNCWTDYSQQGVDNDIWWYYTMSAGFYWSLFLTQFFDVKRKDFWMMFTHHVVTIGLLTFSRMASFTRIGSLVLVLHDAADGPLEFAKMANYAKRFKVCDLAFSIFVILWLVTRICIYPLHILRSTLFELAAEIGIWPAYYLFNILLCSLFVMHINWTYYILKVALKAIFKDEQYKDSRSSSDEDEDDDDVDETEKSD